MKYRKRPVVIEAAAFLDVFPMDAYRWVEKNTLGSFDPMPIVNGRAAAPASGVAIDPRDGRMIISTLEGLHWVNFGDFVIRGVQGEFYPCKPDIFVATYEPVTS